MEKLKGVLFSIMKIVNKNIALFRSTRSSYGDRAIGYVQVKRVGGICTVKAKITPEHKVHSKNYNVITEINETKYEVLKCDCTSCAASSGMYEVV